MTDLVADTSGLVSLGIGAGRDRDPLACCLDHSDVLVPDRVVDELREIAAYDDDNGRAADAVLARTDDLTVQSVTLDEEFPLEDGENAAITLANEHSAELFLCDEFTRLGLIHASLANTRLVTTPTLLSVFVRQDRLSTSEALALLDAIGQARSWDGNSYVERARSLLE